MLKREVLMVMAFRDLIRKSVKTDVLSIFLMYKQNRHAGSEILVRMRVSWKIGHFRQKKA